jgi:hypothetical protein
MFSTLTKGTRAFCDGRGDGITNSSDAWLMEKASVPARWPKAQNCVKSGNQLYNLINWLG